MKNLNLAGRIFNTPLLVEQGYLATFVAAFAAKQPDYNLETIALSDGTELTPMEAMHGAPKRSRAESYTVHEGVGVIPISGTLVNKGSQIPSISGMQGYNGILGLFSSALNDPRVESIVLDIDSSGGEVAGLFELCDLIAVSRDEKPIAAYVGETACSAAYAIACSAETIYMPRTGVVGSIGVVVAHQDMSEKLANEGVKVTLLHAGKHKVDANPFEALSDEVRASIQTRIDETRSMFVELVATNRGLPTQTVMDTEAQVYTGARAVELGLADEIMSFNEVITTMTKKTNQGDQAANTAITGANAAEDAPIQTSKAFDAMAIVNLCEEKSASHLAGYFIKQGASEDTVKASLDTLGKLSDKLTAAGMDAAQVAAISAHFADPAELAGAIINSLKEEADISTAISEEAEADKKNADTGMTAAQETALLYSFQNKTNK